jgi:hypothetical protein
MFGLCLLDVCGMHRVSNLAANAAVSKYFFDNRMIQDLFEHDLCEQDL